MEVNIPLSTSTLSLQLELPHSTSTLNLQLLSPPPPCALRIDAYLRKTACFCYTTRNLVVGG